MEDPQIAGLVDADRGDRIGDSVEPCTCAHVPELALCGTARVGDENSWDSTTAPN